MDDWIDLNLLRNMHGGNAKNAGYVKRMEAEKKIVFDKIHRPSKYMIDKYGNMQAVAPQPVVPSPSFLKRNLKKKPKKKQKAKEPEYEHPPLVFHHEPEMEAPLFHEHEIVDFNVSNKKPKKKVTKSNRSPTEAEEERQEVLRQKELERKQQLLHEYENLKTKVLECKKQLGKEDTLYHKSREELKGKRWKKTEKAEIEQELGNRWRANRKRIMEKYPEVFQYIKKHKLNANDLTEVSKHIKNNINAL